jgi:hypothetical protein
VYNLATAAAAAGINKSTVLRHIKSGQGFRHARPQRRMAD